MRSGSELPALASGRFAWNLRALGATLAPAALQYPAWKTNRTPHRRLRLPTRQCPTSTSPRRKQLLEDAGVRFVVHASDVDETLEPDLLADPPEACKKLAERKAGAVVQEVLAEDYTGMAAVIGADTMVVCEGEIFGKPVSLSDAKRMLRCLSGRTHEVLTAVSVWMVDRSAVTFRELTDEEIVDYLRKGESFDKAGAYAVQGAGADLVARVDGAMDTVIGLPVGRLLEEFPDFAGSAS